MPIRPARPGDAESIAKVHVDTWRTTYKGIVPQPYLDGLSYETRAKMWAATIAEPVLGEHLYVAIGEDAHIIGFTCGGPCRTEDANFRGEIYAIYLLEAHQGKGIGRQLLHASAKQLMADGFASALVWVLEENPTCGFYAAMGGQVVAEKWDEIGGKKLKELAYGWSDLASLLK